jgi:3-dehydroquinate synthetase
VSTADNQPTGVWADARGIVLRSPEGVTYRADIDEEVLSPGNPGLADYLKGRRVLAFVGPTVNRLYGRQLEAYLNAWLEPDEWSLHTIRTGEINKTMHSVENVCAIAKERGLDREGVMLAVGGGITADIVGFAAAIYARGVRFVKVNTTLVGQVDVGVGVKTGVNAYGSKNLLGAYHPPHGSISDPGFLRTLPRRQIACGLGEIVKMAIVRDAELFEVLEETPELFIRPTPPYLGADREDFVLRRSMELMMRELCPNLREINLARVVDFGHTFGPVIETASGYRIAHGESVAIDIALSSHLAYGLGLIDQDTRDRIVRLLLVLGLPVFDRRSCSLDLMRKAMHAAWSRRGRKLNLVVPTGIGSSVFVEDLEDVPDALLNDALAALAVDVHVHPRPTIASGHR